MNFNKLIILSLDDRTQQRLNHKANTWLYSNNMAKMQRAHTPCSQVFLLGCLFFSQEYFAIIYAASQSISSSDSNPRTHLELDKSIVWLETCLVGIRLRFKMRRCSVQRSVKSTVSECIWWFLVDGEREGGRGFAERLTILWCSWSATTVPQDWDCCQWALWPWSLQLPPYGTMICKCQPVCYQRAKQVLTKSAACDPTPFRHIRSSPAAPPYPLFCQCVDN